MNSGPLLCLALATMATAGAAKAQQDNPQKDNPLVGAWTIVYVNDERAEGGAISLFGPKPVGLLMFDPAGSYSLQICASGRPKFAASDRLRGTPDEYRATASACTVHWGRYVLNENDGTIVFRIEHALFPNWEGTEQTRPFKMANGYLRYHVPKPATEAENTVVVWKRAP